MYVLELGPGGREIERTALRPGGLCTPLPEGVAGAPWRVRTPGSDQVDLTFTPVHDRVTRTDAGPLSNHTDQCFGHWNGTVRTDTGEQVAVDQVLGWAEDVRMRW